MKKLERVMRFELTTSTLARLRSTPELHPHLARPADCHTASVWQVENADKKPSSEKFRRRAKRMIGMSRYLTVMTPFITAKWPGNVQM